MHEIRNLNINPKSITIMLRFYLLLPLLAIAFIGRAQGTVTMTTAKAVGEEFSIITYCTSID